MYKIETHLHVKPVSSCAWMTPEEMITRYHEAGYDTVFVSDHFAGHHFDKLGADLSFCDKVDLLIGAYEKAKATGEARRMHVLFSPELTLRGNHYLLYNVSEAFLKSREDVFSMTLADFHAHAKAHGVTIVQAHPYRDGKCFPTPDYVDGFEVLNTNPRHENFDDKAMALAKEHGKPMSAGSDAHRVEDIAGAAMLSPRPITTVDDYLALLNSGEARLMKGEAIIG